MEERDMADCLVMLAFAAKSKADESDGDSALLSWKDHVRKSPLLSLPDPRKSMELKERVKSCHSRSVQKSIHFLPEEEGVYGSGERKGRFECSICKKTFRSHQALGGHRASHKKVKGCFARTNAAEEDDGGEHGYGEMSSIALTMATAVEVEPHDQREDDDAHDPITKQTTGDPQEQGPFPASAPPPEEVSMGQFLQFSITCSEKMEEDPHFEPAIAPADKQQLKHQTSSCSSSSSIIAATAAAGTLILHQPYHHPFQQSPQHKIHQCGICNRVFSTGQALGGHKRCHWGGSGMPEAGKKCPLSRQDSDGAACTMRIAMSDQRNSEFSRKGRQDSGSFASSEAWMSIALAAATMENEGTRHIAALSTKTSQGEDEGMSAHPRGWLEASSSNPKPMSRKNQLLDGGTTQRSAIASELDDEQGATREGRGRTNAEKVVRGCECLEGEVPALMKNDELLDLNLPAPAEEEEGKERAASALPPAASNWLSTCTKREAAEESVIS